MANLSVDFDTQELQEILKNFSEDAPKIARNAMAAVNRKVVRAVKREAIARGYESHKEMPWGNAGISDNVFQFANRDFTGKIMIGQNAFQYTFVEYGADVRPRHGKYLFFKLDGEFHATKGFTLPARPLLKPAAERIWQGSEGSEILDKTIDKQIKKLFDRGRVK